MKRHVFSTSGGNDGDDPVKRPRSSNYGHFYSPLDVSAGPSNGMFLTILAIHGVKITKNRPH